MRDIVILGAGGFAREVAFLINDINQKAATWNILGYVDLDESRIGEKLGQYRIICDESELLDMSVSVAIGIGTPSVIRKVASNLKKCPKLTFPNLIHPSVIWDSSRLILGEGNVICAGNILTTDVTIGSFNIINLSCTVGHDTKIYDYCVINPGANISGGVTIGTASLVGTGSIILQYKKIGTGSVVGAGSVVTKDVDDNLTVVGSPARPLVR